MDIGIKIIIAVVVIFVRMGGERVVDERADERVSDQLMGKICRP